MSLNLEARVAAAKVAKYATDESGDTIEMVERPRGGLSVVIADGQRSGKPAKAISNIVRRKAQALLAEGVRDGAAARAAHDHLFTERRGQVSATLNIVSVDLLTRTLVISRNSHCPVYVLTPAGLQCLSEPSQAVGIYPRTKPVITELPLEPNIHVVIFTDGVLDAGARDGSRLDLPPLLPHLLSEPAATAQSAADGLLSAALALDHGRPGDDMTVLVLSIVPQVEGDSTRRLTVRFPIEAA